MQSRVAVIGSPSKTRLSKSPVKRPARAGRDPLDLSWLRHLPKDALAVFSAELESAIESRNWSALNQLLISWRSTAQIYADSELSAKLANPIGNDLGLVPRP